MIGPLAKIPWELEMPLTAIASYMNTSKLGTWAYGISYPERRKLNN